MHVGLVGYLPAKGYDVFLVCPSALVPFPALRERASRSIATSSIWLCSQHDSYNGEQNNQFLVGTYIEDFLLLE